VFEAAYPVLMARAYDAAVLDAALPRMIRVNPALLDAGTFYVAADGRGAVVGCGGWSLARPGSGEVAPGLAHIRHFGTHPHWTGCGVGRAIYERCEADARAAGIIRFECYASLNAEAFYEALGFESIRRSHAPMGSLAFPIVLMERRF
jgi:GNAT superfamily N-acetyltransferase